MAGPTSKKKPLECEQIRILLLRPPFYYAEGSRGAAMDIPLGLLSIAAVLEREGYPVAVFDARVQGKDAITPRREGEGYVIGARWEDLEAAVRSFSPHIVGINCPFTSQYRAAVEAARRVKLIDRDVLTVVGGPHATVMAESFFDGIDDVDVVVRGEGETTLREVAEWYRGQRRLEDTAGITWREGSRLLSTEPRAFIQHLDELPFPAYHLVDLERYFALKKKAPPDVTRPRFNYEGSERSISAITSRGCPFECVFCSIHPHMGKRWRAHSPRYILDHLSLLAAKYGVRHVHFEDDNLTLAPGRFKEILDGMRERALHMTWDTPNGVRADTLDENLLTKCRDTGCVYLIMGVESGDQSVLDHVIGKRLRLEKVVEVARLAEKVGIDMRAFYVIGFPGENPEQMRKTMEFALSLQRKYRVLPNLMKAYPLAGTPLRRICADRGYLVGNGGGQGGGPEWASGERKESIRTEDFTPSDVGQLHEQFQRQERKNRHDHFVSGLMKAPGLALYILRRAVREQRRWKEFCADTVLFQHYLRKTGYARGREQTREPGQRAGVTADAG